MTVVTNTIPSSTPTEQTDAEKAHLIAVAEGTAKPGDAPKADDQLILGKFKSHDDLIKAYAELEKKLGNPAPKVDEVTPDPAKVDDKKTDGEDPKKLTVEDDAAKKAVEAAGLDFASYNDTFAETGDLTADQRSDLEKKGFSKETVDVYLDGLRARQTNAMNAAFDIVGGADNYKAMGQWAAANLAPTEREAFNAAVSKGTAESRDLAIRGLYAKFTQAAGEPELATGRNGGPTLSGFRSWDEVKVAMGDKRYGKDKAYTADVQNKMKISKF